jgi:hypothetical protein
LDDGDRFTAVSFGIATLRKSGNGEEVLMADNGVDLSAIRFVKRVALGGKGPSDTITEEDREEQIELLNRCLSGIPPGKIIALEVTTTVSKLGDLPGGHQVIQQMLTYHVGFESKPYWLEDEESAV